MWLQKSLGRPVRRAAWACNDIRSAYCKSIRPDISPNTCARSRPSGSRCAFSTSPHLRLQEDAAYQAEIADIERWWQTPRFEGIRRCYGATDVASKRGTLQQTYPSSVMARKLFELLRERGAKGEPVHTSRCTSRHLLLGCFHLGSQPLFSLPYRTLWHRIICSNGRIEIFTCRLSSEGRNV